MQVFSWSTPRMRGDTMIYSFLLFLISNIFPTWKNESCSFIINKSHFTFGQKEFKCANMTELSARSNFYREWYVTSKKWCKTHLFNPKVWAILFYNIPQHNARSLKTKKSLFWRKKLLKSFHYFFPTGI